VDDLDMSHAAHLSGVTVAEVTSYVASRVFGGPYEEAGAGDVSIEISAYEEGSICDCVGRKLLSEGSPEGRVVVWRSISCDET
jgi:hypothetical protein